MTKTFERASRWTLPVLVPLILSGCGGEAPPAAGRAAPEVSVVTVEPEDARIVYEFVGKTESSRRVEIRARVDGYLQSIAYREGTLVREGEVLFRIDPKPLEADLQAARAELAQQRARLDTANRSLDRVRPLAAANAVPQKELDDAEGQYRSARAAVEAASAKVTQAELNLGYATIESPVTGISSFAKQREGAYIGIGSGSLLTYVAQLDPMWVEFSVSENQILQQQRQTARGLLRVPENNAFDVEIVLADGTVHPYTGRISFADAALSETTGTFLVRAEIPNPEARLRPGQFVRVIVKGAVRPDALVVPQRAVQQGAQGSFVWVIGDEGKAELRPVELGRWHEDDWFVDAGLAPGDRVVVDGGMKLGPGVSVRITDATAR